MQSWIYPHARMRFRNNILNVFVSREEGFQTKQLDKRNRKKKKKKTVGLKDLENSISVFIISENIMGKRER